VDGKRQQQDQRNGEHHREQIRVDEETDSKSRGQFDGLDTAGTHAFDVDRQHP